MSSVSTGTGEAAGKREKPVLPFIPQEFLPFAETLAGFAAIVAINLLFFRGQWGFLNVEPHPFWILTVFVPLLYGSVAGIFTGAVALGLHVLFQATADPPHTGLDFGAVSFADPVLLLAAAVIVGEVRKRVQGRIDQLQERNASLETAVQDLATRFTEAEEAKGMLQRRILGQTATFTSLYDVARKLDTLEEGEIPTAAAEVTGRFLEAELVSVCAHRDGKLEVLATYPLEAKSKATTDWLYATGVLREALDSRRSVSLRDLVSTVAPTELTKAPLAIAAPLLDRDGTVMGFILVERIGFLQFTPTSLTTAGTIAQWTSKAMQDARLFRETRDRNVEDEITGAFGSRYMVKRLREEIVRASTYHFPMTVAVLQVMRFDEMSNQVIPDVLAVLGDVFRHKLRPTDLLGRHPDGSSFILVFPHTTLIEAGELSTSLVREVEAFQFRPFKDDQPLLVDFRLTPLGDGANTPEQMIGL